MVSGLGWSRCCLTVRRGVRSDGQRSILDRLPIGPVASACHPRWHAVVGARGAGRRGVGPAPCAAGERTTHRPGQDRRSHRGAAAPRRPRGRSAADAGDPHAIADLTQWLIDRGGPDEAITTLRGYVDRGIVPAAIRLAELLINLGRSDEGIELMRSVAHEDETAAMRAGVLLGERGRVEEAAAAICSSPRPLRTLDVVCWQLNHDGYPFAAEAVRLAVQSGR